jgi:hypothetical protein
MSLGRATLLVALQIERRNLPDVRVHPLNETFRVGVAAYFFNELILLAVI